MFNNMTRSDIINLMNEAPTRFLTNEISIFKTKYNQMVTNSKLNKAPFVTPNYVGLIEDPKARDDFIDRYIDELSDDRKEAIINTYGISNAMDLLYILNHRVLGDSEDVIKTEMENSSMEFIERETMTLILNDVIGANAGWMNF